MKKLFSLATLLGALAGAASAAPYVLPSPQPGALTPYDWQPVYAIEGLYSIAQDDDMLDTYGVRGSFNLYNSGEGTFRHQWSVNVSALWGSDDVPMARIYPDSANWAPGHRTDFDLFMLPVTFGYTLNMALSEKVMFFIGGKAGAAWARGEYSTSGRDIDGNHFTANQDEDTFGFVYSVGAGLKVQCSDAIYVHAGYEFGRSYFDLGIEGKDLIYGAHTISLGIGCQF